MPFEILYANSDNPEFSDNNDATGSGPASGGVVAILTTYVSGGLPTAITVNFRAFADDDPSTISDVYLFISGLDLGLAGESFVIPQDSVVRDYEATLDFLATPAEIRDALLTPDAVNLEFILDGFQNAQITELSVRVDYTLGGLAPPCHLYPRDDDQGVGTSAIWPPASSGGPGSYY